MPAAACNEKCLCKAAFDPVCGEDNITTYYSPCFAGCERSTSNHSVRTLVAIYKVVGGLNNAVRNQNVAFSKAAAFHYQ